MARQGLTIPAAGNTRQAGRTHAKGDASTHRMTTRKAPKHRNLLPAYHGPVPVGDQDNIRGLPAICPPSSRA